MCQPLAWPVLDGVPVASHESLIAHRQQAPELSATDGLARAGKAPEAGFLPQAAVQLEQFSDLVAAGVFEGPADGRHLHRDEQFGPVPGQEATQGRHVPDGRRHGDLQTEERGRACGCGQLPA